MSPPPPKIKRSLQFCSSSKKVLNIEPDWVEGVVRAKRPKRLPVVLKRDVVLKLLNQLSGSRKLLAYLIYGSGLRLMEAVRLRVKDVDLAYGQLIIRGGKGDKDRVTVLPESLHEPLKEQIKLARRYYELDREEASPGVELPHALERKYPNAGKEWPWFWVFPAKNRSTDPRSGVVRRHHLYEKTLQRDIKQAARNLGLSAPVSMHTLRHSLDSPHPCGSPFGRAKARQILFQTKFCDTYARKRL